MYSRTETQPGLGNGRTKFYPSDSVRTLLKNCFAGNQSNHFDPRQQTTRSNADKMIQFARSAEFGVSLATFGLLEDLLLKMV